MAVACRRREQAGADHAREHLRLREAGGARGGQLRRGGQGAPPRHGRGGGRQACQGLRPPRGPPRGRLPGRVPRPPLGRGLVGIRDVV